MAIGDTICVAVGIAINGTICFAICTDTFFDRLAAEAGSNCCELAFRRNKVVSDVLDEKTLPLSNVSFRTLQS